ncbi:hypothetical protein K439DRAFT_375821 [Ramaria rubella]|nr:hypothetical protein K439DRAFT_375821 [Ramaria rubella]
MIHLFGFWDSTIVTSILNDHIPRSFRPNIWVMDPGSIALSQDCLLRFFFNNDSWLLPLYSSRRQRWLLSVIDWRRRRLWYIDSSPLRSNNPRDQGDTWTWTLLTRFIALESMFAGIDVDLKTWVSCAATYEDRQLNNVDSGVWMCSDIEAWYLGNTFATRTRDIDGYRLVIRRSLLELPPADPNLKNVLVRPMQAPHEWIGHACNVARRIPMIEGKDVLTECANVYNS